MPRSTVLALLLLGLPSTLLASTVDLVWSRVGDDAGDHLGLFLCAAGDLDGDGAPDFAVGAPGAAGELGNAGEVWVYFGGPGLDPEPDLVLRGRIESAEFGRCVRAAGDLDGDGHADLAVGAPLAGPGRVYVFRGGPDLDAEPDLVLEGETSGDRFGWSVCSAGDLDGGGDDLAVGAPNAAATAGRVSVFSGGAALDTIPDHTFDGPLGNERIGWYVSAAGDFDADGWPDLLVGANISRKAYLLRGGESFDAADPLIFTSPTWGDRFGYGLESAGDLNSDGHADIVIGAMHDDTGGAHAGRVYIYYGGPDTDTVADRIHDGEEPYSIFGRVMGGGCDLDGDGRDDLVVGAPTADVGGEGPGWVHVFSGGADSLATAGPAAVITGLAPGDRMGAEVALVGDVNDDGHPDFIAGADLVDGPAGSATGAFYLYSLGTLTDVPPSRAFTLAAAAPNPFNPATVIAFELHRPAHARLQVFDLRGRLLRDLVAEPLPVGHHHATWDGRDAGGQALPSGTYLYRLTAGRDAATGRMALVR